MQFAKLRVYHIEVLFVVHNNFTENVPLYSLVRKKKYIRCELWESTQRFKLEVTCPQILFLQRLLQTLRCTTCIRSACVQHGKTNFISLFTRLNRQRSVAGAHRRSEGLPPN